MTADDPEIGRDPGTGSRRSASTRVASARRRPVVAGIVLFLVYVAGSFVTDPGGSLSSDVGSKVAAVRAAEENGGVDIDVGYWAEEADPDGSFHALYQTHRVDDAWVPVTTLPFLGPAIPLWWVGGYRAVVLLAMLGSVATAFAARSLAMQLGAHTGWSAYWLTGLASPVALYALVFWEHSVGLALMAWAVVALVDAFRNSGEWWRAGVAGLLFGVAGTMRTEALLFGAVATAVVLGRLLVDARASRRKLMAATRRVLAAGCAALVGVALPLLANDLLERAWLGASLRSGRATGAAGEAVEDSAQRIDETFRSLLGLNRIQEPALDAVIGFVIVATLVGGAVLLRRRGESRLIPVAMMLTAWALLLAVFADGLSFLPGLFIASPLAAYGVVAMWGTPDRRMVGAIALLAVPGVLLTAYVGGAGPQWGGRYLLLSGLLLLVVATVALRDLGRVGTALLVGPAIAVTVFGFAWTVQRSHALADFGRVLEERPEPVVISASPYQLREVGAFYEDGRYLTLPRRSLVPELADLLEELDVDDFALVDIDDGRPPVGPIGPYEPDAVDTAQFLPGVDVTITHYEAVG